MRSRTTPSIRAGSRRWTGSRRGLSRTVPSGPWSSPARGSGLSARAPISRRGRPGPGRFQEDLDRAGASAFRSRGRPSGSRVRCATRLCIWRWPRVCSGLRYLCGLARLGIWSSRGDDRRDARLVRRTARQTPYAPAPSARDGSCRRPTERRAAVERRLRQQIAPAPAERCLEIAQRTAEFAPRAVAATKLSREAQAEIQGRLDPGPCARHRQRTWTLCASRTGPPCSRGAIGAGRPRFRSSRASAHDG